MTTGIGPRARAEWVFVLILCCLAAVRVFVFSAAFPFFNHVDEDGHFDLVYKYSLGRLPAAELEGFSPDVAKFIALYRSPELILGVLVPFLLIYLGGLARCLRKLKRGAPAIAVTSLVLVMTVAEFWLHAELFRSRFNWYHLD